MPQKTRREKIEAAQRRQYRLIMRSEPVTQHVGSETPVVTPTFEQTETVSPMARYLIGDLRKSILLILAIFALEFFLYFVRIGNHI